MEKRKEHEEGASNKKTRLPLRVKKCCKSLHWAACNGDVECITAHLEAGADINAKDIIVCQEECVVICAHA
jgi:ankyrin repeat protein